MITYIGPHHPLLGPRIKVHDDSELFLRPTERVIREGMEFQAVYVNRGQEGITIVCGDIAHQPDLALQQLRIMPEYNAVRQFSNM